METPQLKPGRWWRLTSAVSIDIIPKLIQLDLDALPPLILLQCLPLLGLEGLDQELMQGGQIATLRLVSARCLGPGLAV